MPLPADAEAKLNDGERQVLLLLSAGHTIKTAAAELGLTENSVNERLRSARQKTGATSSRELARALYPADPQISCDELSVVRNDQQGSDEGERRFPIMGGAWTTKGIFIMSTIALLATAFVAFSPTADDSSPEADAFLPPLAEPGIALREKLESEVSDPDWALATQKELGRRFTARDGIGVVAVRCRTTLCEVNAQVAQDDRRKAIRSIADRGFLEGLADVGTDKVETIDMRFVDGEEGPGTITVFLARAD